MKMRLRNTVYDSMSINKLILKNCSILKVSKEEVIKNGIVVIKNRKFRRVDKLSKVKIPKNSKVLDLEGCMLVPGLIDCHTHLTLNSNTTPTTQLQRGPALSALYALKNAKRALKSGFTCLRDLGGDPEALFAIKEANRKDLFISPKILVSGNCITSLGGHASFMSIEVEKSGDIPEVFQSIIHRAKKIDWLKLMVTSGITSETPPKLQLKEPIVKAAVSEAHHRGIKVAAHAQSKEGAKIAVFSGVDSLEHGFYLDDEIINRMKRDDIYLVPTLSSIDKMLNCTSDKRLSSELLAQAKEIEKEQIKNVRKAVSSGVSIATGTDTSTPCNKHGDNKSEIILLVEKIDLTPIKAIQTATLKSAHLLGVEKKMGTIEEGKLANCIALRDNPLKNIRNLNTVKLVLKEGSIIEY